MDFYQVGKQLIDLIAANEPKVDPFSYKIRLFGTPEALVS